MPIYMDRHIVQGATDSAVEDAHNKDLEMQSKYKCDFLTYWYDSQRGSVFCLVDAPNKDAVKQVHEEAHGLIPHEIIEVDLTSVESFLGRTTDPKPVKTISGNEIVPIDSAFRCVLFTDLKGSTSMSRNMGDTAAIALLDKHDNIIQKAIKAHSGRVVKHTGDGFMASFTNVDHTVKCSIAIQEAFAKFNTDNPETPLHIRIGINAGEPIERGNDLFGMTVQLAARICDQCKAEEILVSGVVYELCSPDKLELTFIDAGKKRFKGFEHAIQVYSVTSVLSKGLETEPSN